MYIAHIAAPADFWSDDYCGRRIAAFNHADQWHVYLDHRYQHNLVFATAEQARTWLRARIDTVAKIAATE
jgi:hypothetical protein